MSKLKVIALISGGKDSFFSILHCQANSHEIIGLANLYPETSAMDTENEDIDSFMYQTVGHSVIPLYAEALGIPLYRQKILGGSGSMERDYAPAITSAQEQDETESLVPLLKNVKEAHPDANAICTGAILSTYQRTRIESIALRLGLIPLSYLWQFPSLPPYMQTSLLEDMRDIGQDSRIIKVASGALDESFLWKNVADRVNVAKMAKGMEMFGGSVGGAVLGEGGEFETLVVDGPSPLWKGKIEAGHVEIVKGEGGSAVVRLKDVRVVKKEGEKEGNTNLRIPEILDTEFKALLLDLEKFITKADRALKQEQISQPQDLSQPYSNDFYAGLKYILAPSRPHQGLLQIPNIFQPSGTPSDQLKGILEKLSAHLDILRLTPSSLVSTTLLLRSMADFASLNPIYGSFFATPNPPSRVTISCGDLLPPDVDVVLSTIVDLGERKERQGLHVQSRSYWAPANIGPYSQAISIPFQPLPCWSKSGEKNTNVPEKDEDPSDENASQPRIVHIAGQIPLVPASMEMVMSDLLPFHTSTPSKEKDFIAQTTLSIQHLFRIGRVMNVQWWTGAIAFISSCSVEEGRLRAQVAIRAWNETHRQAFHSQQKSNADEEEDDDEVDIWDLRNRGFCFPTRVQGKPQNEKDTRSLLPDYRSLKSIPVSPSEAKIAPELPIPLVFIAQVAELPRGADIEWFSNGLSGLNKDMVEGSHQYYLPLDHIENLSVFSTVEWEKGRKEGFRSEWTVYTTKALPKKFVEEWKPVTIPCYRIWWEGENGMGAVEIDGFFGVRQYRT
jgi:diphthine-ammonia ligase